MSKSKVSAVEGLKGLKDKYLSEMGDVLLNAVLEVTPDVKEPGASKTVAQTKLSKKAQELEKFINEGKPFDKRSQPIAKLVSLLVGEDIQVTADTAVTLPFFGPAVTFGKYVAMVPVANPNNFSYKVGKVVLGGLGSSQNRAIDSNGSIGDHLPNQVTQPNTVRYATRKEITAFIADVKAKGTIKTIVDNFLGK